MTPRVIPLATLVTARLASLRETAIAEQIDPNVSTAVLAEGLPDGADPFERFAGRENVQVIRIASGCPCCIGNLPMRVLLNRLLRMHPCRLFISLAPTSHLHQVAALLSQPPYDTALTLTEPLFVDAPC